MRVIRITDPDEIKPLHVVMVCLVAATLLGSCLLTSGPHSELLHDGAVEWGADSPLRAVVQVLNLQFTQTTAKGVEIKALVFGVGTALAMLVLAFAVGLRPRAGDDVSEDDTTVIEAGDETVGKGGRPQVAPLVAAQLAMLAFALWALASPLWAGARRDYALGGAIMLVLPLMWSFGLGLGLNRIAARVCAYALLVACVATAAVAIWYNDERNPTLRASYPLGNPLFLAACLVPGILISAGVVIAGVQSLVRRRNAWYVVAMLAGLAAAVVMLWAFYLTGSSSHESALRAKLTGVSRGPAAGLLAGAGAMLFFALRGRRRLVTGVVMIGLVLAALLFFFSQRDVYSATGRSQSLRLRFYAWSYALELGGKAPLLGNGPGTYVLAADALAAGEDVLADPQALEARLAHAHNEWLELWCDLGSVGLVLMVTALVLTLLAGATALGEMPAPSMRWTLIALLAALVGLVVEEAGGNGLRLPGLPAVYFTVIGLIWAMSCTALPKWMAAVQRSTPRRLGALVLALALAVAALAVSVREFQACRDFYSVAEAQARADWGQAVQYVAHAANTMLDPQRRLDAADRLCATHLYSARERQKQAARLEYDAWQEDPPDDRRLALAQQEERASIEHVQAGLSALGSLLKKSPGSWNSGALEHGFYLVLADFDRMHNRPDDEEAHLAAAVAALDRELRRRPFDPNLALTYVATAGDRMPMDVLLNILARPLRYKVMPADYLTFLQQAAQTPSFDEAVETARQNALAMSPDQPVEQWQDPWAPEKLRLAAVVLVTQYEHQEAEATLARAAELYYGIRHQAPMGAASCHAELADARFYADPDHPARALETGKLVLEMAPNSEFGRRLSLAMRLRMITYLLAGLNEKSAAAAFAREYPEDSVERVQAEFGARYWQLIHSSAWRSLPAPPQRYARWVERALALNPEFELRFREEETVRVLRAALQLGTDLRMVFAFINAAMEEREESPLLQKLHDELAAFVTPVESDTPTTQPNDTL